MHCAINCLSSHCYSEQLKVVWRWAVIGPIIFAGYHCLSRASVGAYASAREDLEVISDLPAKIENDRKARLRPIFLTHGYLHTTSQAPSPRLGSIDGADRRGHLSES